MVKLSRLNKLQLVLLFRQYLAACGHLSPRCFVIRSLEGDEVLYRHKKLPPQWCPACMQAVVIRCGWCGLSILPGDPITLYSPLKKGAKLPEYAVVYQQDPLQIVGCGRPECADTGADYAGVWVPPGTVLRHMSLTEQVIALNQGEEEVVVMGDPTDFAAMQAATQRILESEP